MDVGAVTEGGLAVATEGAEVIYNLGADEVEIAAGPFVIYQGSHGDRGAIAPTSSCRPPPGPKRTGCSSTPKGGRNWPSAPGLRRVRPRRTGRSCARLSAELGAALPWDSLAGAARGAGRGASASGRRSTKWPKTQWQPLPPKAPAKATFRNAIKDFYLTNPIARAVAVMAELSAMAKARAAQPMAAE